MQAIQLDRAGLIDGLGRSKFSRHLWELVQHIDASQGAVVGLEGAWGSGKTSVLQSFTKYAEELSEEDRPLVIEFNPWMLSGTNSLVDAMLIQFASELDLDKKPHKDGVELAGKILEYVQALRYAKYAAPFAGIFSSEAGVVLGAVSYAAEETATTSELLSGLVKKADKPKQRPSLNESKKDVIHALKNWPRRIVMILDDIDRLPPRDVAAMVQAVKAVADFPNVVYVLAYDPEVVAHAVEKAVEVKDGVAYLEKIIQLPVRLPNAPQTKFNHHAKERLNQIVQSESLGSDELADLEKAWSLLFPLFRTPRDIERLRTRLQVALPILKDLVNIADILLLEALDITHPAIIVWIERNASALMQAGIAQFNQDLTAKGLFADDLDVDISRDERLQQQSIASDSWKTEVKTPREKHCVGGVLCFMFDKCLGEWDYQVKRSSIHRVQVYRFWYQWRCYHDHNEPWAVSEIEGFLKTPSTIIAAGLHLDRDAFLELTYQICDIHNQGVMQVDLLELVAVFSQAEKMLGIDVVNQYSNNLGPVAALEYCIHMSGQSVEVVRHIIDSMSVWFSQSIVVREFFNKKERHAKDVSTDKALWTDTYARWVDKAEYELSVEPWDTPDVNYSPYKLLDSIARLGFEEKASHLAEKFLNNDSLKCEVLFSNLKDSENFRAFDMKINWEALPKAQALLPLVTQSNIAEKGFSMLFEKIKSRANHEDLGG